MGNQALLNQLLDRGFDAWRHTNNFVCFKFKVPHGKFRGKELEIALQAPHFPRIPPTGPHIKPHLFPPKNGGQHPTGGIHNRNIPTNEFQYWSRPFRGWQPNMNIEDYLSFIRTLFDIPNEI